MKITAGRKGGIQEEIDSTRIGKAFGRVIWDLFKIVAAVALALWVIWIVVPDPWWRYLSFAPQVCGVLYPLRSHG